MIPRLRRGAGPSVTAVAVPNQEVNTIVPLEAIVGGMMADRVIVVRDVTIDATRLPRVEPLSYDQADKPTRELWDEMREPPNDARPGPDVEHALFRTFMHHPVLFRVHSPFVQYLKNSTTLPVRHREIAILRSAWNCGVDDQWVNHTRIGLQCGLAQEDIDRIPAGADAPGWTAEEVTLLRAVDDLHFSCRVGDGTWAALARQYDKRQLIELLLLMGNYRTLAYVQNSVGIRPVTDTTPNIPGNRFLFPAI
jgi:alkylhydroperoxidase family enzyme